MHSKTQKLVGSLWLGLVAARLMAGCSDLATPWPVHEIAVNLPQADARSAPADSLLGLAHTAEAQGFDSGKLADALLQIREQHINVHSLL
jgi:hypothetical protein